jgi:hypothetical protein
MVRVCQDCAEIGSQMAKIIATTFGGVLILLGLVPFASVGVLGMHTSPLVNLVNLVVGGVIVLFAQKTGPSASLICCVLTAAFYLLWGLAGVVFGQPGQSTLLGKGFPPDKSLLVIIPSWVESGWKDHLLHIFAGLALGIATIVSLAETPLRLRK